MVKGIDCQTCPASYQQVRGCKTKLKTPAVFTEIGISTDECPRKCNSGATRTYLELFNHYKNGILPCRGSLQDQPMKIMQVFQVIDDIIEELREKGEKDVK